MKMPIIKTEDYLLVVDDSEIKDFYYDEYCKKVHESGGAEYSRNDITKNIIAYLPINHNDFLEGVPLLPPLEVDDDVDKIAREEVLYNDAKRDWWKQGYNKRAEKFKFAEEHVRKAIEETINRCNNLLKDSFGQLHVDKDEIIQSLLQSKIPTHFEFETKTIWARNTDRSVPTKDDLDDVPKTTTNSQGQLVACGKYLYE